MNELNEGSVEATLEKRGSIYGSYSKVIAARGNIMEVLKEHHLTITGYEMSSEMQVAMGDLVLKLVRGAGAPSHDDSWHDLGGYAKLIEDMVKANKQGTKV